MYCPYKCEALWEHMKDAAASHLQRARIICLFLHLCLSLSLQFSLEDDGRVTARGQPSALIFFCGILEMTKVIIHKCLFNEFPLHRVMIQPVINSWKHVLF